MRGCLFTLVLGVVVLALIVVFGLPIAAASVLTAGVTANGLQADDTRVTVTSDPPTDLLFLHADEVRIRATDATFRDLRIGTLDVTLRDVAIVDRTAAGVDGRLDAVVVPDVGGREVRLTSIVLEGGRPASATTTLAAADAEALIERAIAGELGARPSRVSLAAPDVLTVVVGVQLDGRLAVSGAGDLVVRMASGPLAGRPLTVVQADDFPIRLTSVTVTGRGELRLVGELTVGLLG